MRTLVIKNLSIAVDALGDEPAREARQVVEALNKAIQSWWSAPVVRVDDTDIDAHYENDQVAEPGAYLILIPDYDPDRPEGYPGGIRPGPLSRNEVVGLLRQFKEDPEVIQFLADMLEE